MANRIAVLSNLVFLLFKQQVLGRPPSLKTCLLFRHLVLGCELEAINVLVSNPASRAPFLSGIPCQTSTEFPAAFDTYAVLGPTLQSFRIELSQHLQPVSAMHRMRAL
jgi:hypothetical protein